MTDPRVTWIMQTNLGSASDIAGYAAAVRASGAAIAEVEVIPFSDDLPDLSPDGPVVLYGSVSFVTRAHASGRWQPGAFSDPDTFTYEQWARQYGSLLLNSPDRAERTTIAGFLDDRRPGTDLVFVRPERDSKELVGEVWSADDFRVWCETATKGVFAGVSGDTRIVVCQPYGIEAEWRLFVASGEIVAASQYRHAGRTTRVAGAPPDILAFGRDVASRWDPAPLYVLDVCLSAGNPYVVEAQGFNSAGTYGADLGALVAAANTAASVAWQQSADAVVLAGPRG